MPEEDTTAATPPALEPEEGAAPMEDHVSEGHNYKYRKLLYLFKFSKHHKKIQKKKAAKHNTLPAVGTPEERRNQLDQDMKNSWDTLPETLRKRKQRVSRALLSEFIDADNPDVGDSSKASLEEPTTEKKNSESEDAGAARPSLSDGEKTNNELDAMHRSGVYFDDEDVDDEDDDSRSSASSGSADKNEVCIYQVQRRKNSTSEKGGVEIMTTAMFHKQDENDNDIVTVTGQTTNSDEDGARNCVKNDVSETQVGEEEVYQKIMYESESKASSLQRMQSKVSSQNEMEEIPAQKTDELMMSCDDTQTLNHIHVKSDLNSGDPGTEADSIEPLRTDNSNKAKETTLSDSDSGVDANKSGSSCDISHSSLGENNCNVDEADYATVGTPLPVEVKQAVVQTDVLEPQPVATENSNASTMEPMEPLGLDSEALAAVEMLARAVSSDSLLLESNSGGTSPANSHASLNIKLGDDDSGTDVNIPSSSSPSSSTSSCAGDVPAPVEAGEYEDVATPVLPECNGVGGKDDSLSKITVKVVAPPPLPPPNHHYEAMMSNAEQKPAAVPLYSSVGKLNKLPAPGALPLPGMYSDLNFKDNEGGKPQFLLEALSKRAASKVTKQEDDEYTVMEVALRDCKTSNEKGRITNAPTKTDTTAGKVSRSPASLSQLSAQKFPPVLTAPIFYNPLAQCHSPLHGDQSLKEGLKRQCPLLQPQALEPGSGGTSDSEHLTDSFDEDETSLPSGKSGLLEEPLWRRPSEPSTCTASMLCRRSVTMETIVEEPPGLGPGPGAGTSGGPDDSRLTVREILRRFEELGGKVPSLVESCDGENGGVGPDGEEDDEEKSATLREIQETLMNLEEKVRNYQCKIAADKTTPGSIQTSAPVSPQPPHHHHHHHHHHHARHQRSGGRLDSLQPDGRKSLDGWTGRVSQHQQQSTPPQQHQQQKHHQAQQQHQQQQAQPQQPTHHGLTNGHHPHGHPQGHPHGPGSGPLSEHGSAQGHGQVHDGKHSLLQFAIHHFRQSPEKFEMLKTADGSISGSLDVIESLKAKKNKGKSKGNKENEWTWKEQVDLVKFSPRPIEQSLLRLDTAEMSELAVECFVCVMRYMGDLPMTTDVTEVKCVYTVLMHCHKHESLRDEVYCQLMKQTTNNKSQQPESCQRGWRLFSIVAAYFTCSDTLKPYLFKYLETAAYDKRRAYHGTAMVCLQNLRKTFKYGGRKNVPSVEEITAISAGRNSKRQMYRLPGGTERVVNTRSTTVVQDVIEEICGVINVTSAQEMEEFSLYCIVEGDTFTMPLAREEYVLDVTTELHKNQQVFYLIFCRSVWHFPLRLDSHLYIEVVFNQIAPDYLEGLLLVMPGETLQQDTIYEIAKMAALLHRAADMTHVPAMKETKFLLPKPALTVRDIKPAQWVNMVQSSWVDVQGLETIQAKAQVLEMLSRWPLFGSSFFAVKRISDPKERADHILALNRHGVHFIDIVTHETLLHHPFSEVISTRKVKSEDGTLFLDMKCGNLMQQRITRLQTDQAHEISRLIRQYITLQQRVRT